MEQTLSPLEQRLLYLVTMVHQVREVLKRDGAQALPEVLPELAHLEELLRGLEREFTVLETERRQLQALQDVSQVVNSSLDLSTVLQVVMDTIIHLTGAERAFLMLRDEAGRLHVRLARNWERENISQDEVAISHSVVQRVVESGQAVLTTNAQEDPRFKAHESVVLHNLRSILCVPLQVKGRLTGVIYADNRVRSGVFTEAHKRMLVAFANQAAVALENARLFERVRQTLAEVTELKNLLDNVFASIASGVITTDMEERITLCNQAAERILGRARESLLGRPLEQALAPLTPALRAYLDQVRREGRQVVGLELTPIWPQRGRRVFWQLHLSPLRGMDQRPQGVTLVVNDLTDRKELEATRAIFERMVSPAVIEQLDPETLRPGGRRALITTLFADVRGFTAFSEAHDPEELVAVLNRYLAAAAEAVLDQEGTIDKFMGDAIMAWFNAPLPQPDHALRAVRTALLMRQRLQRLQAELPPAYHLTFGVGIHTGEAVLGLIGTERRLEYTAIGDSVNTAKRIQENAGPGQILISAATYALVREAVVVREAPPLHAKGKSRPVTVYEVVGLR